VDGDLSESTNDIDSIVGSGTCTLQSSDITCSDGEVHSSADISVDDNCSVLHSRKSEDTIPYYDETEKDSDEFDRESSEGSSNASYDRVENEVLVDDNSLTL